MKWISNKSLFNIHGWLGLNLGLLLFVICFSGTFATLSNEIDWLLNPDMRIEKQNHPPQWEAMYTSLQKTFPEGKILGIYKNNFSVYNEAFATTAHVSLPNGQTRKVYLNPYSGQIQGHSSFLDIQRFFRSYHRRFFDGERGIFIITFSSFFLFFSGLTGFLFYKGWLKNLFKFRIKSGIKNLFSDAHKLTGIWSLLFVLLIALTGIFYFTELVLQNAGRYDLMLPESPAQIEQSERATFGSNLELLTLDTYVKNAQEAYPELDIQSIRVPHTPSGYVYIDGQVGNPIVRDRANNVHLHPYTGDVVHIQRTSDLNVAEFITDTLDPLHFGYFGGLPAKILWFILGLAISFAVLSGTYLWYIRGIEKKERRIRKNKSSQNKLQKYSIDGKQNNLFGYFIKFFISLRGAIISTTFIVIYLIFTGIDILTKDIRSYGPLPEERFTTVQNVDLGPWNVDLICEYRCNFQEGSIFARFNNEGIPNYDSLYMEIDTADDSLISLPFTGDFSRPSIKKIPRLSLSDTTKFQLTAKTLDGEIFTAIISPDAIDQAQSLLISRFSSYPEKSLPEVPLGIYLFLSFFGFVTTIVLIFWCYFLARSSSGQFKFQ